MSRRTLLVANPSAQSGKARPRIERAQRRLRERGHDLRLLPTEPGDRTVTLVQEDIDKERWDLVVYLGGDGTFAQVAKGILAAAETPPLGMLPSGTANDQGRSFGISSHDEDLERNLDVIEAGHLTQLNVGRVGRIGRDGRVDALEQVFHSVGWAGPTRSGPEPHPSRRAGFPGGAPGGGLLRRRSGAPLPSSPALRDRFAGGWGAVGQWARVPADRPAPGAAHHHTGGLRSTLAVRGRLPVSRGQAAARSAS